MTTELPSRADHPLLILVVDPDPAFADLIREALDRPGWRTLVVEDRMAAITEAERQAPDLVMVDVGLPGASDLLARFARRDGGANTGPGAMALVPAAIYRRVQAADYRADELIAKPFSVDDLTESVERWFATPAPAPAQSARLSSEDLFGDILAEVETTIEPAPSAPMDDDLERKLEMTLSGLLNVDKPRQPKTGSSGNSPRRSPAGTGTEIDQLLDKTLGTLAQSRKRRPVARAEARLDSPAAPPAMAPPAMADTPAAPPRGPISVLDDNPDHFATRKIPTLPHLGPSTPATPSEDANVDPDTGDGERFGEYALLERIAVGGMAEVWRARRTGVEGFQKTLAIKKILSHLAGTPDIVSMLVDEAKLAAQLSHDNIIQIYDLGKVEDTFFIAMELVDGMDLRSILTAARQRDVPLPIGQALWIAARLAHALDHAHRKQGFDGRDLGIVHRDVSPQNVLIGTEGEIKLCDFGIARAVSRVGNTEMGALKGKLQYMSPEQAWGREVDSRTDIFSLGAVLFEMLTGTKLFAGDSEIGVLDAVRDCQVPHPRALRADIPEDVEAVLLRALAKMPEERYQRAGDMAADLDDLLRGHEPQPTPAALAQFVVRLSDAEPSKSGTEASATATGESTADPRTHTGTQPTIPASTDASQPAVEPRDAATDDNGLAPRPETVGPSPATATPPAEPTPDELSPVANAEVTAPAVGSPAMSEPIAEARGDAEASTPTVDGTPDAASSTDEVGPTPLVPPDNAPGATGTEGEGEAAYDLLGEDAPKAKRNPLPWIVVVLVLAGLVVAWFLFQNRADTDATALPDAPAPAPIEAPLAVEPTTAPDPETVDGVEDAATSETPAGGPSGVTGAADAVPATTTATDTPTGDEVADSPPALDPDIEQMVADEIERRAERLRQDFERERRVLQDELDKAKETAIDPEEPATEDPTGDDEATEAEPSPPPSGGGE